MESTENKHAVIGAGPCGLSMAKHLIDQGIEFDGYDAADDVGGIWNIKNPISSVYESAHLISSKSMTEFKHFPMGKEVADYPSQREMFKYFQDYANHFGIREKFKFNSYVEDLRENKKGWLLTVKGQEAKQYKGVILCNGALSAPNYPDFKGEFGGTVIHSKDYFTADIFENKRVLVVGGGNSACDIAVDAIHRAKKVSMSVRRGYHFVPKYIFGKPADTIGGNFPIPVRLQQKIEGFVSKWFTGDPVKLGFPEPDHDLYQVHPIVNSLVLYHLGHGDMDIKKNIDHFEGKTVHFSDGSSEDYDIIVYCTGYKLSYPFIDRKSIGWTNGHKIPNMYLHIFHPEKDNLFIIGMIESTGLGWEYRSEQGRLVSLYLKEKQKNSEKAKSFQSRKKAGLTDLSGGSKYLDIERMAFYVHKKTYQKEIQKEIKSLS